MEHMSIKRSNGRNSYGTTFYYVRPAMQCMNRSRRIRADKIDEYIKKNWPIVEYFVFQNGSGWTTVIGGRDEQHAWKEYRKIADKQANPKNVRMKKLEGYDITDATKYFELKNKLELEKIK